MADIICGQPLIEGVFDLQETSKSTNDAESNENGRQNEALTGVPNLQVHIVV